MLPLPRSNPRLARLGFPYPEAMAPIQRRYWSLVSRQCTVVMMEQSHPARNLEEHSPLVLVVDDNDNDIALFRRAVGQLNYSGRIRYLNCGAKAMAYLGGTGDFEDRTQFPSPGFLILDLKMPGTNGFDVLTWLLAHHIPELRIVVLTSSDDLRDVVRAAALGAPSFLTKSVNFSEFRESIGALLSSFEADHRNLAHSEMLQVA
jgi:DNA-binding response OmpR family regulator